MDECKKLQNTLNHRRAKIRNSTTQLFDVAQKFLTEQVSPKQKKFGELAEIWSQLLPEELCRHCEIVGISGGKLKVGIDSPAYKYEIQLCSAELLKELQQHCPKARLTEIKFVLS
ncbi:MAG: DUF721 domain-containing protein [Sedimentisphaerales bacterium]|nr:DUF721 domain-containing protein [Sedimentisphaerales bacterium]